MGIGPVPATRKLCARLGLKPADFDVIELNEAFAAQGLAVLRELGIADDAEYVNPNGGAIALGHPLGMSGARITGTAALELHERGASAGAGHHVHRRRPGHRPGGRRLRSTRPTPDRERRRW
jgi:acetyl-CoA acyltransferase